MEIFITLWSINLFNLFLIYLFYGKIKLMLKTFLLDNNIIMDYNAEDFGEDFGEDWEHHFSDEEEAKPIEKPKKKRGRPKKVKEEPKIEVDDGAISMRELMGADNQPQMSPEQLKQLQMSLMTPEQKLQMVKTELHTQFITFPEAFEGMSLTEPDIIKINSLEHAEYLLSASNAKYNRSLLDITADTATPFVSNTVGRAFKCQEEYEKRLQNDKQYQKTLRLCLANRCPDYKLQPEYSLVMLMLKDLKLAKDDANKNKLRELTDNKQEH